MKKRWAALILCLLLALQVGLPPASAVGDVYFVGAEENILPLSDVTMPFWSNNYLYISPSVFTDAARDSLKIGMSQSSDGSWVALYWGSRALLFKKGVSYAEDQDGKRYYPGVSERNGELFVPAALVADFFGIRYSVLKVAHGSLVWLRTRDFILGEDLFTNAASNVMAQRYEDYQAAKRANEGPVDPEPETPPEELIFGKPLYLCVKADEETPALLNLLDRYDGYMTFFCTPEYLAENDDLLRRMAGSGHAIGILAREGEGLPPVTEQLRAGNEALVRATFEKTRLVRVEQAAAETVQQLLAEGYRPDPSVLKGESLRNSNRASELLRAMNTARGTAVVWLEDVNLSAMTSFLTLAARADDHCVPLTETVPIS